MDIFASTFGEFAVDGCEGTSPVLQLQPGVQYTFLQADVSNIGHPLAFAYGPEPDAPRLASPTPAACGAAACGCDPGVAPQAPRFVTDGVPAPAALRDDDDDAQWAAARDAYVLAFQAPEAAWAAHEYAVQLTIPAASKTAALFYTCAVFPGMAGLVRVAHPPDAATSQTLNALPAPFVPAAYYERMRSPPAPLDVACGTRGLGSGGGMMSGGGGTMRGGMMGGGMMRGNATWGDGVACGPDTPAGQFGVCMRAIERAMMMPSMPNLMMGRACQAPLELFVQQVRTLRRQRGACRGRNVCMLRGLTLRAAARRR